MKIYKIIFDIDNKTFETLTFASNSEAEAMEDLKNEMLEKYNPETVETLHIFKVMRQ